MGLNAIMQDAIGGEFTYYPSDNNDVMIAYNQDGSVRVVNCLQFLYFCF